MSVASDSAAARQPGAPQAPSGSGPLGRLSPVQRSSPLVVWRPVLVVLASIGCSAALLLGSLSWSPSSLAGVALLLGLAVLLPACLLEHRSRCLVGLLPPLALLYPLPWWGIGLFWLVSVGLAAWLGKRAMSAVPEGLKQRQLAKQLARYPLLHSACLHLATARDRDQVAQFVVNEALQLGIGAICAGVYLPQDEGTMIASAGQAQALRLRARTALHPLQQHHAGDEDVAFVAMEGRQLLRREQGRLRLLLPLLATTPRQGQPGAVLEVYLIHDASIDDYNIELQEALARMGGIAVGTADLLHQTRSLAMRDSLTGLFGQHEFRRRAEEALSAARRQQQPLSLAVCDLDRLKDYNDQYGHLSGDRALGAVAQLLQAVPGALAGRWGGEEFMLLLPGQESRAAQAVVEQLRRDLADQVVEPAQPERRVTASFGISEYQPGESLQDLIIRADAACYAAKEAGRNCVRSATASHGPGDGAAPPLGAHDAQ